MLNIYSIGLQVASLILMLLIRLTILIKYNINKSILKTETMPTRSESDIRKRIQASGNPHDIQQLCLDGIQIKTITPSIKRLLQSCTNLAYLTMNDCSLLSLDNFPHLKNLIALELTENKLTGEDFQKLCYSPNISYLMLDMNQISSLSVFNKLSPLKELEILQIHSNEVTQSNNYRQYIFEKLPSLNILDFYDRNNNMVQQEDQEEYISEIGQSRRDLLQFLDQSQENIYEPDNSAYRGRNIGGDHLKRSYSLQTAPSPQANQLVFKNIPFANAFQRQKQIMVIRTAQSYDSESEDEENELMKQFKKKMRKKD